MKAPKWIYIVYKSNYQCERYYKTGVAPTIVEYITCGKKEANIRYKFLTMAGYTCAILKFPFDACGEYVRTNMMPGCELWGKHYDKLEELYSKKLKQLQLQDIQKKKEGK